MKHLLFIWMLICSVVSTQAQKSRWDEEFEKVEDSQVEVIYSFLEVDTVLVLSQEHNCILQIGENYSLFKGYAAFQSDSVMIQYQDSENYQDRSNRVNSLGIQGNYYSRYLYDFDSQTYDAIEIIKQTTLRHFDNEVHFDWEYHPDTMTVCGYLCRKATADFRGKRWMAWYTEELPYSLGPWKLKGLPGMILSAQDTEATLQFTAEVIRKATGPCHITKGYIGEGPKQVSREESLAFEKKVCTHYDTYMSSHPDFKDVKVDWPKRIFYVPKELQ